MLLGDLRAKHRDEYRQKRCPIPGKLKPVILCPESNKCSECPYGRTPETKQAPVISWDELVDSGWEPTPEASVEHQVMARLEYETIRALMDAEDPRIAMAFEAKTLYGDSVREIAADLGVSEPRVYQLIARARAIGREYRQNNG
jgi:DNA-directed RNA polymerase specialized sigma24 family protein